MLISLFTTVFFKMLTPLECGTCYIGDSMSIVCCWVFQARRHAESLENAVWTDQFDNTANRRAHYETTGPEIWNDTSRLSVS